MTDTEKGNKAASVEAGATKPRADDGATSITSGDNSILPRGQMDPIYEEKARVLNRAVRSFPRKDRNVCSNTGFCNN